MLEALDDLRPNEVYVATGGSFRYAFWGELMSTRARYLRAAGAVLNGFVRDAAGIEALGFPTFCRGLYAQDQGPRGKVIDFRVALKSRGSGSRPAISSSATARASSSFPPKWRPRRSKRRSPRPRPRTGSQPPSDTAWARGRRSKPMGCCELRPEQRTGRAGLRLIIGGMLTPRDWRRRRGDVRGWATQPFEGAQTARRKS